MKRAMAAVLLLLGMLLLSACAGQGIAGQGDGEPAGSDRGYYAPGQSVSGGQPTVNGNLKDISIEQQGRDTVVTLSFRTGSDDSGVTESDGGTVPAYQLTGLEGISRFVLSLEGMSYWDYAIYGDELTGTVVRGIFHQSAMAGNPGALYLNLSQSCDFRSEQSGSQLRLYFRPTDRSQPESAWYLSVNGFDLYTASEQQSLLRELGLYPTYCSDMSSIILLSGPFDSKQAAQDHYAQHEQSIGRLLPGRVSAVVELGPGELPLYDEEAQVLSLIDSPVGMRDGEQYEAEVLRANGRFLCWAPDGVGYVYAKSVYAPGGSGTVSYEELWYSGESESPVLAGHEFTHILSAAYSADGRYLAVQEQNEQLYRNIEIVDMLSGESLLPVELGFGMDTPGYTWDREQAVLYAITGEGEGLRFMAYDLTDREHPLCRTLRDFASFESALETANGRLYFIQWPEENITNGQLCSMAVEGGEITVHTEATDFELSPDGKYAAVSGNTETGSFLSLYELQTGRFTVIEEEAMIIDKLWDASGRCLYYSLYDFESGDDNLPLDLVRYKVEEDRREPIMDMIAATLHPAEAGKAVLVYIFTQVNQNIPMSYRIDLP